MQNEIIFFRNLGLEHWLTTVNKMNNFIIFRHLYTFDEIWCVQHYPIFTKGRFNTKENIIHTHDIQVVNTDRGGQITYHGPGQQILYFLIDLQRRKISVRQLIDIMQRTVMDSLQYLSIKSYVKDKSPGVYANKKKICSLGLRVKKRSTLHGLALNVDMDLEPFKYIYPCGDKNMQMTQIKDFNISVELKNIRIILIKKLSELLKVKMIEIKNS